MNPCRLISVIWPETDTLFSVFLKIFRSEFLIQDLIPRAVVNQNEISIYQSPSLVNVDYQ